MKKLLLISLFSISGIIFAKGQDYSWGVGIRGGGHMSGATIKYKMNATNAVEAILAYPYNNGFVVTGLYERHIPLNHEGFNIYYGGGAHVGSWSHKFAIGVDGVVGIEYKIPEFPVAFSADYKPVFNFPTNRKFYLFDFALSVRYTF